MPVLVRTRGVRTRSTVAFAVMLSLVVLLAGCATPPPPKLAKTTVTLLPDEDGNVGAVSVSSETGSLNVDQAYSATTVNGPKGKPSDVSLVGRESIDASYAGLLKAQPPKPKSFMLNFLLNKTILTEESKAQLPALKAAVRERKPTEITIFGHADASGTEKYNLKLSADRANTIAEILRKDDPTLDRIDVQYFGAKNPLIESKGSEAKNRRAEVMIL